MTWLCTFVVFSKINSINYLVLWMPRMINKRNEIVISSCYERCFWSSALRLVQIYKLIKRLILKLNLTNLRFILLLNSYKKLVCFTCLNKSFIKLQIILFVERKLNFLLKSFQNEKNSSSSFV